MSKAKILVIAVIIILVAAMGLMLWKFFQPDILYLPGTTHKASSVIEDGNAGE